MGKYIMKRLKIQSNMEIKYVTYPTRVWLKSILFKLFTTLWKYPSHTRVWKDKQIKEGYDFFLRVRRWSQRSQVVEKNMWNKWYIDQAIVVKFTKKGRARTRAQQLLIRSIKPSLSWSYFYVWIWRLSQLTTSEC